MTARRPAALDGPMLPPRLPQENHYRRACVRASQCPPHPTDEASSCMSDVNP